MLRDCEDNFVYSSEQSEQLVCSVSMNSVASGYGPMTKKTKKSDDLELTPKQKTKLLALGIETPGSLADVNEQKADLLYDVLEGSLPPEVSIEDSIPVPLKGLWQKVSRATSVSIRELLTKPTTNISVINKIKEYAKQLGRSTESEDENDVFLTVYYAAIAYGMVTQDKKITEHSYEHLVEAFDTLIQKDWVSQELRDLFAKAYESCKIEKQNNKVDTP